MKKLSILAATVMLSACTFITDPLCTSTKDVELAVKDYKLTENIVVYATADKIMEHIKAQSERSDWLVFQNLTDVEGVVLMGFEGYIDTSEVGVFIRPLKDRCLVQIASLNRDLQHEVAKILYPKLVANKKK